MESPNSPNLKTLQVQLNEAFKKKQTAFEAYIVARDHARAARQKVDKKSAELKKARSLMASERKKFQDLTAKNQKIWDTFKSFEKQAKKKLKSLRTAANAEHKSMVDCNKRADNAHIWYPLCEPAEVYRERAAAHKARRDELNAEIRKLESEIQSAHAKAIADTPKIDTLDLEYAESVLTLAKIDLEDAEASYRHHKTERDRLHHIFLDLQASFKALEDEYSSAKIANSPSLRRMDKIIASIDANLETMDSATREEQAPPRNIFSRLLGWLKPTHTSEG